MKVKVYNTPDIEASTNTYICDVGTIESIRAKALKQKNFFESPIAVYSDITPLFPQILAFPFSLDTIKDDLVGVNKISFGSDEFLDSNEINVQNDKCYRLPTSSSLKTEERKPFVEFVIDYVNEYFDFTDFQPLSMYEIYLPFFNPLEIDGWLVNTHLIYINYYISISYQNSTVRLIIC